ncbi:nuclear transport factor 2 family protein [Sphingobium sp. SYK-6]|uniref:nuclear transport factor 2 family protein n=1 Tax=Sphingobium sp. (strain NBRC 103272 / SYK-6) TaxID=627192 RepID=UPI001E436B23|nr:nuclear transport factor 2 family protein [Sphingobium sp. SYK-6]
MDETTRRAIEWDCTRLINQYTLLNDAADWEAVAALYAEDGQMARPSAPDKPVIGRDAILAAFLARPARAARHVVSNVVVDVISETEATAKSIILLYQGSANPDGGLPIRDPNGPLIGTYTDRLCKTTEGWRFAERIGGLDFAP